MKLTYATALTAVIVVLTTPASAEPRYDSHYEMVTTQLDQNVSFGAETRRDFHDQRGLADQAWRRSTDKVIILDKRSGELWAWSERFQTVMYLGQIFPLAGAGPFARVIHVPEEKAR
ncbi:MAG TPA: hypothetical protein VKD19_06680 [Pseudolabrys sp.]|nr:hypothetical protein [Pseudolabrys sp.]